MKFKLKKNDMIRIEVPVKELAEVINALGKFERFNKSYLWGNEIITIRKWRLGWNKIVKKYKNPNYFAVPIKRKDNE